MIDVFLNGHRIGPSFTSMERAERWVEKVFYIGGDPEDHERIWRTTSKKGYVYAQITPWYSGRITIAQEWEP